ncbi:MAG: MarR family winged helix-turn-helix transcriptional regulator [Actinomycetes bacterium]
MTSRTADVEWLTPEQQHTWRAYLVGTTLLMDRLDRDLRASHDISLPEYEVLVRLSESSDNRVRMATLADSLSHSRSRVTHTVTRLEKAGLVERVACAADGRGVEALLTEKGWALLQEAAPMHVRSVRECLVDLAGEDDFAAVGRVFDAVTDKLVSGNPAADIR